MRSWRGNETLVIYSDNGTVGEGVSCGSRDEATVGSNCDDDDREVMSIPTTISWDPGVLLLSIVTPHYHTHCKNLPLQDVAIIRNMTTSI